MPLSYGYVCNLIQMNLERGSPTHDQISFAIDKYGLEDGFYVETDPTNTMRCVLIGEPAEPERKKSCLSV